MGISEFTYWNYWLIITAVIFARYFLIAGISYYYFYHWKRDLWSSRKLQQSYPSRTQVKAEIRFSISTLAIYSLGAWLFLYWMENDFTLHYADVGQYGWGYLILSFFLMIVLHDAYFYWTHRLMHHRRLYRWTHGTHHIFRNPTPWCAFAFHPVEAFLSMGIIPLIVFFIPWHYYSFIAFISFMTLYDVYIHLGVELSGSKQPSLHNTTALHDLHHEKVNGNYGLYFTFWDRIMGTYYPAHPREADLQKS